LLKVYIASGTAEYLQRIMQQYKDTALTIFHGKDHSLLVQETGGKTIFHYPKVYVPVESVGKLPEKGWAKFFYIPVLEEFQPVFEYEIKKHLSSFFHIPGFISLRFLKPMNGDTYAFFVTANTEALFQESSGRWKKIFKEGKKIPYPRPGYSMEYRIGEEREDEKNGDFGPE